MTVATKKLKIAEAIAEHAADPFSFCLVAQNGFGWVYHANSGKPYLAMGGNEAFRSNATVPYVDGSGQFSTFYTVSIDVAALNNVAEGWALFGDFANANGSTGTVGAFAYNSSNAEIAEDTNTGITQGTPFVGAAIVSTTTV